MQCRRLQRCKSSSCPGAGSAPYARLVSTPPSCDISRPRCPCQGGAPDRQARQQRRLLACLRGQVQRRGASTRSGARTHRGRSPLGCAQGRCSHFVSTYRSSPPQFVAVKVLRSERVGPRDYVRAATPAARQAPPAWAGGSGHRPAHTPPGTAANLTHRRTIPRR